MCINSFNPHSTWGKCYCITILKTKSWGVDRLVTCPKLYTWQSWNSDPGSLILEFQAQYHFTIIINLLQPSFQSLGRKSNLKIIPLNQCFSSLIACWSHLITPKDLDLINIRCGLGCRISRYSSGFSNPKPRFKPLS